MPVAYNNNTNAILVEPMKSVESVIMNMSSFPKQFKYLKSKEFNPMFNVLNN